MEKRFTLTVIIFALIVTGMQQNDLPTVDQIMSDLKVANDALQSIEASFIQEETNEFGDVETTTGHFYFLSPGRYMLNSIFDGKVNEEMGKNAKYAWRIRHHLGSVDKFKVKESDQVSEGFLFTDADELNSAFDLKLLGVEKLESGDAYHLKGKAREKRKIREIEIWINVESPAPIAKAISYQKRKTTMITFNNIKRDVKLDSDMFVYRVPRGYQEINH